MVSSLKGHPPFLYACDLNTLSLGVDTSSALLKHEFTQAVITGCAEAHCALCVGREPLFEGVEVGEDAAVGSEDMCFLSG